MKRVFQMLFLIPLCVVSMFTLVYFLSREEPLFFLKHVKIEGVHQLKDSDIISRVSPFLKESLIKVDVTKMTEVLTTHPFVREVSVRRVFPFSLVIDVKEKRPSALWVRKSGEVSVLDETGEPYRPLARGEGKGLFVIHASDRNDVKSLYGDVTGWMKEGVIKREGLSEVAYAEGSVTLFTMDEGVEIILGKEDQKQRLKKAMAVLEDAKKRGLLIKCIDARFERGAIIQERKSS